MSSGTESRSRVWTRARPVETWLTTSRSRGSTRSTSAQQTSWFTTQDVIAEPVRVMTSSQHPTRQAPQTAVTTLFRRHVPLATQRRPRSVAARQP